MRRTIVALTIALALAIGPVILLSSCAAVASVARTVITAVTQASCVIDTIEQFTNLFFVKNPAPDVERVVGVALTRARAALAVVSHGGDGVNRARVEFEKAYTELLRVVAPLGVAARSGPGLAYSAGSLEVPAPDQILDL